MIRLDARMREWARQAHGAPALWGEGNSGPWTRGRLVEELDRWSHALGAAGVGPASRAILAMPRGRRWVAAHLALLHLGAVTVPADPGATADEFAALLGETDAAFVLAERIHPALDAALLRETGRRAVRVAPPDEAATPRTGRRAQPTARRPDDLALLLPTSGTTGRPKLVILSHGNLAATARCLEQAWELSPADRLLHVLPLFHVHGLLVALHAVLGAGGAVRLESRLSAAATWAALAGDGVTLFMGVPTLYHRLLGEPPPGGPPSLPAMRLFTCGSAPLPAERLMAFERLTGHRILERYGLSETGMVCGNSLRGPRRPGSVGHEFPGVVTRLWDAAAGAPAAPGSEGEVQVRGPQVCAGYLERPEETAAAFTADGWFRTGDIGRRGQAGDLVLCGRIKDLIISGGFNVQPQEVEAVLLAHPAVAEAAVVGRPHADLGEEVAAVVVLRDGAGADEDALLAHCRQHLRRWKCPRRVAFADALPRTALGKLQRQRLAGDGDPWR